MAWGRGWRSPRLRLSAAGAILLAGWTGAACADDLTFVATDGQSGVAKIDLIDDSRLGCSAALSAMTSSSTQCAFDTATRGAQISARQEAGSSSFEAYATVARTTTGAFTPDQLLMSPDQRANEATNLAVVGFKGSTLNNRLKLTAEFARTERVVDQLLVEDAAIANYTNEAGSAAKVRLDATLIDKPGLKWSVAGEYQSTSDDFSMGRSSALALSYALPGTRLALSTKGRMGQFGLSARLDEAQTPFGSSSMRKAAFDMDGVSLSLVSRETSARPIQGSSLLDSRTRMSAAYLDVDPEMLAGNLFPNITDLPMFVPSMISVSYSSGKTENRYEGLTDRYSRSSLGIDGSWNTPLGETSLSYWRDTRTGLTEATHGWTTETFGADHFVRRGNWRFGIDASLTRTKGDGVTGYDDRTLSFGQSIAYSAPNGPEFRLQMGQDRGSERTNDLSYVSSNHYSSITASLDLSEYLRKRFERPDLHLTLDYRKLLDRTDSEMNLYDELVDRWVDTYRRQGFLMSFGMQL